MTDKRIVVPEGMLKAASRNIRGSMLDGAIEDSLEAALRWLSENPIVPTRSQTKEVCDTLASSHSNTWMYPEHGYLAEVSVEFQRRMFLVPESDRPYDAILNAALDSAPEDVDGVKLYNAQGEMLAEAYR